MPEVETDHIRLTDDERAAVMRAGYGVTSFTDQMQEAVERIIADRIAQAVARIEEYEGKVPGYLAESPAAASVEHDACPRRIESGQIRYACGVDIPLGTSDAYAEHVRRFIRNEGDSSMTHAKAVRTNVNSEIERWDGDKWVPDPLAERTETTETTGGRPHIVSDDEECWCGPTTTHVPADEEAAYPVEEILVTFPSGIEHWSRTGDDDYPLAQEIARLEAELDSMHGRLADSEKSFAELDERFTRRLNLLDDADGLLSLIRYREAHGISPQTKTDLDDLIGRIRRAQR